MREIKHSALLLLLFLSTALPLQAQIPEEVTDVLRRCAKAMGDPQGVEYEIADDSISVYDKESKDGGFGGHTFTIRACDDMSQYGEGPLYDEMRRTIIEIRMGRNFDDAWKAMSKRLKSTELERVFGIILDGRKSGSSISTVLLDVSDDLRDLLALKRERKSTVMMSVMFLLISAIIATPFAIGMVSVYSGFMQSYGMESEIILTAPIAGEIYMLIHSVLVGFIISIIMYGEIKKGIKFSLPLAAASFGIFYVISTFGENLLMGGF